MRIFAISLVSALTLVACASGSKEPKPVIVPQPDTEAARVALVAECDANPPADAEGLRICECARTQGAVCPAPEFPIIYPQ